MCRVQFASISFKTQFDSGTRWSGLYIPIKDAPRKSPSPSALITGTEVHCRHCGRHLRYVFDDGLVPRLKIRVIRE